MCNLILMAVERANWAAAAMTRTLLAHRQPIASVLAGFPIANDLCFVLQRANRIISRGADTALRATGLTAEQTLLLAAIAEAGSPRATDLARNLSIDASTIAANLKPLVRNQLVLALVDVADRRARRLHLTAAGSERLERGIKQLQEYERDLALESDGFPDLRELCHALGKLTNSCP